MGQDVNSAFYTEEDFLKFEERMNKELDQIRSWEVRDAFSKELPMIGLELEGWFVNNSMLPNDCAPEFLSLLSHSQVVPEIAKFNFEINSSPFFYENSCFNSLQKELDRIWFKIQEVSNEINCHPLFIGTLPTLRHHMLSLDIMSPNNRYNLMNTQVMNFRENKPLQIQIEGKDKLDLTMNSVISECAATSLQIHLGVTLENSAHYYNASLISSCFLIAISANSPYLFGKELWDESRILGFEQSVDLKCEANNKKLSRVTFGSGFIKRSIIELFEENVDDYPVILPENFNSDIKNLESLKLHNGTIWRWTRPVLGFTKGKPSLRIEQRSPSSGPTVVDSIANSVFFLGLVDYLADLKDNLVKNISFTEAHDNFYKAAKQSFYCQVTWIDGKSYDMQKLLLDIIIPKVKEYLVKRNIDKKDIDYYVSDIIYNRCKKGINGATWQKAFIHMYGKRFQELTQKYYENQKRNIPVHLWEL